jgi:hypothetical protein
MIWTPGKKPFVNCGLHWAVTFSHRLIEDDGVEEEATLERVVTSQFFDRGKKDVPAKIKE